MDPMEDLSAAVRGLQAECNAQAQMLMALISSHPDQDALRQAWDARIAASMAMAATQKAAAPERAAVYERLIQGMQRWTDRLAAHRSSR